MGDLKQKEKKIKINTAEREIWLSFVFRLAAVRDACTPHAHAHAGPPRCEGDAPVYLLSGSRQGSADPGPAVSSSATARTWARAPSPGHVLPAARTGDKSGKGRALPLLLPLSSSFSHFSPFPALRARAFCFYFHRGGFAAPHS